MSSWAELQTAHPAFAAELESSLTRHSHCVLGTIRADGTPRLSGIEAWFWQGDLMLGMMPASSKARDLDRNASFELHSAPLDKALRDPDARIWGRAHRVTDADEIAAFAASLPHADSGPVEMDLFRCRLTGAALTSVEGERLVVRSWRPGTVPRRLTRR